MFVHRFPSMLRTCPPPPQMFILSKILIDCLFEATFGQSYLSLKCSKRLYCMVGIAHWKLKII